jgi:hypothetical protein
LILTPPFEIEDRTLLDENRNQFWLLTQIALRLEVGVAAPAANSTHGTIYHLISRGDRREKFRNHLDQKHFLQTF